MVNMNIRKIKTGSYSTYLCESGEQNSESVIFLHGGGPGVTAESNWRDVLPGFSGSYRVVAPDLAGYGNTDHPDPVPQGGLMGWMRLRVEQILTLMDELDIAKAHLVGNSMGGALALHLVMTSPERFQSVVLMGSAGAPSTPTPEVIRMLNFYKDPTPAALGNLLKWFVYDENIIGDKLNQIVQERFEEVMRPEVRRSYESMFSTSPAEVIVPPSALRRMNMPFLLVHGRDDRFVSVDSSVYMLQHLPNVQLHVFDRCGHWAQLERKESFTKLVTDFFKGEF